MKRIENPNIELNFKQLQGLNEYLEEHVVEYISKHASFFKSVNLNKEFSQDEKYKYDTCGK